MEVTMRKVVYGIRIEEESGTYMHNAIFRNKQDALRQIAWFEERYIGRCEFTLVSFWLE